MVITLPLIIISPSYELPSASERLVKDLDESFSAVASWVITMEYEPGEAVEVVETERRSEASTELSLEVMFGA